jgi:hypothetical protein
MHRAIFALLAVVLLTGCDALSPLPDTPTPTVEVQAPLMPATAPTVEASPTLVPATATPSPIPPTPTPVPVVLIVSADGDGVFIRITPEKPDRYKAWADGTAMVVVGDDRSTGGRTWKNVRDPDGNVGWIPDQYLKPAPTPTATG